MRDIRVQDFLNQVDSDRHFIACATKPHLSPENFIHCQTCGNASLHFLAVPHFSVQSLPFNLERASQQLTRVGRSNNLLRLASDLAQLFCSSRHCHATPAERNCTEVFGGGLREKPIPIQKWHNICTKNIFGQTAVLAQPHPHLPRWREGPIYLRVPRLFVSLLLQLIVYFIGTAISRCGQIAGKDFPYHREQQNFHLSQSPQLRINAVRDNASRIAQKSDGIGVFVRQGAIHDGADPRMPLIDVARRFLSGSLPRSQIARRRAQIQQRLCGAPIAIPEPTAAPRARGILKRREPRVASLSVA